MKVAALLLFMLVMFALVLRGWMRSKRVEVALTKYPPRPIYVAESEIMQLSDVMRHWPNPAVRNAHRAWDYWKCTGVCLYCDKPIQHIQQTHQCEAHNED